MASSRGSSADIVGLPEIVIMVGFGVLIGPSALDIAEAPIGSVGVELILTVGVGFILFYGGLSLSLHVLRTVSLGLTLLVLPGVIVTAAVTGLAAAVVFGLPADAAFLMGAVLAPTDPAILIPLFSRMRIRPKVAQTVIAESAFNDPTGAILALAIAGVVVTGHASVTTELASFVRNLASSAVVGLVVGFVLAATVSSRRMGIWRESPAIAALVAVSAGYFSLETIDGSGYLGAFIAGLIVGNMDMFGLEMNQRHERELLSFVSSVADIVTMLVFITLGANLPLEDIWGDLWAGLAVLAVFILVARPLAVLVCTYPDRRGRMDVIREGVPLLDTRDGRCPGGPRRHSSANERPPRSADRERGRARDRGDVADTGNNRGVACGAAGADRAGVDG